jgi:hypothetical protein
MPTWASQTPVNLSLAAQIREASNVIWDPEPAFTLFRTFNQNLSGGECFAMLPTMQEHHPGLFKVEVFGIMRTLAIDTRMRDLGFIPSARSWNGAIGYRKPTESISHEAPLIELDARAWRTKEDVYDALLGALEAPAWHGHNFNALHDSIVTGNINKVEAPFSIRIINSRLAAGSAQEFMRDLTGLFQEFVDEGCPVSLSLS